MEKNFIYIFLNEEERDLYFYEYLSICSLLHTQNVLEVFIYSYSQLRGYYIQLLEKYYQIQYKSILLHGEIKLESKLANQLKYSILKVHLGIYIDSHIIFLKHIDYFHQEDHFSYDQCIIGSLKTDQSFNLHNIDNFQDFLNNQSKLNKDDIFIIDNNNSYLLEEKINDWNFGLYFQIVQKKNLIHLQLDEEYLKKYKINNLCQDYKTNTFHFLLIYFLTLTSRNKNTHISSSNSNLKKSKLTYLNSLNQVYWINLNTSNERRKRMEELLVDFPCSNTRIEAVNGNENLQICNRYFKTTPNQLSLSNSNKEYAIILSHLHALQTLKKNIEDQVVPIISSYSLICEDDLSLEFIDYWNRSLETIVQNAPDDWEILMLGHFTLNLQFDEDYRPWNNDWSALSYLINHKALNKLEQIKCPQENKYHSFEDVMVADNYLFRTFITYVYKYPLFTFPKNNDSTLHHDHIAYHEIYKNNNYFILENKNKYF